MYRIINDIVLIINLKLRFLFAKKPKKNNDKEKDNNYSSYQYYDSLRTENTSHNLKNCSSDSTNCILIKFQLERTFVAILISPRVCKYISTNGIITNYSKFMIKLSLQLFCHNRKSKVRVWHLHFENSESSFSIRSKIRIGTLELLAFLKYLPSDIYV
jgi:hypothetical protein